LEVLLELSYRENRGDTREKSWVKAVQVLQQINGILRSKVSVHRGEPLENNR